MSQSPPQTRNNLQQLADSRLAEAKVLLANNFSDGAVYLAGYAVELALKARICKILNADYPLDFSNFKTHAYSVLIRLAGLEADLKQHKVSDSVFDTNWSLVASKGTTGWSEDWRYRPIGSANAAAAQRFLKALDDSNSGVLTWLKTLW